MKKLISVCLAVMLCFTLCSCDFMQDVVDFASNMENAQSKTFEFDGLSIELTTSFLRMDFISEEYDFVVGDGTVTVMGMKMLNADTDLGDLTVKGFAENFRSLMEDSDPTEITEIDGIPTMNYTAPSDDGDQTIAVMFYKGSDCFWAVCFGCYADIFTDTYGDICKYAKTVECD